MANSATQHLLNEHVARYHDERITWWTRLILLIPTVLICALTFVYGRARYSYRHEVRLQHQLTSHHKSLAQQWNSYQKASKRLKALTREYQLMHSQLPEYLTTISEVIPDTTLLTSLTYTPNNLLITGYADSSSELAYFMMKLSSKLGEHITLNRSSNKAYGVYFELEKKST